MTRALRVVDARRPFEVFEALRDALAGGGPAVVPRAAGAEEAWPGEDERVAQNVALVIETSGSTGRPKRVALSTDALLASAAASAGAMGGQGQWLLALPAHYVAGAQVLVRSLAAETEPVVYGDGHFDAARFAALAAELDHDFRYTSLVPVQLSRLIDAVDGGDRDVARALRRFDGILIGGQALSPVLRERAEEAGARILSTYGSSETAGGCVYDRVPIGTTVVREVDGLLEISGPSLAEGYLGDAERTAAAFHEESGARWYRTGDLGRIENGLVTVLGRSDNVIISGGEKVLLDAVEREVHGVAGYANAVVVAVPDPEWGTVPVVVVPDGAVPGVGGPDVVVPDGAVPGVGGPDVVVPGAAEADGALASLRSAIVERLGRPAAPAGVLRVDALPRLSSGKPDRVEATRLATAWRSARPQP